MASDGKTVEFETGGKTAGGYLVGASEGEVKPALIVIQEWWGLNDHIKDIAGRFADLGYTALAPDLYDGVSTKDPGEAGKLMQNLDQNKALAILNGAVDYLRGLKGVDSNKIGVTGFCMGGTYSLLLACHNKHIKASAPFYGDIPPDDVLKNLSAPVLFFGADQDQWINMGKMNKLKEGLSKFGKEGEVKVYSGVGHAFFNDTRPDAYNKDAATDAWERVKKFFAAYL